MNFKSGLPIFPSHLAIKKPSFLYRASFINAGTSSGQLPSLIRTQLPQATLRFYNGKLT